LSRAIPPQDPFLPGRSGSKIPQTLSEMSCRRHAFSDMRNLLKVLHLLYHNLVTTLSRAMAQFKRSRIRRKFASTLGFYGIRDYRGGGRSSGRETACRVAAGAVAKSVLKHFGIRCMAYTDQIGSIKAKTFNEDAIENNPVRCPDPVAATDMVRLIEDLAKDGDSIGGAVTLLIQGAPTGLGDPVFDKFDAVLSHALMSIGTIKGIEFGEGFGAIVMKGSDHNDVFVESNDGISTKTNHAGGILGGITSGQEIRCRLAIKPPSSISKSQQTVTKDGVATDVSVTGRHDPCICPRVVPVVEAMAAIVVLDRLLIQETVSLVIPQ